ncbi:MAG: alanyl-tRNA editing protein [Pseudomonadota bacterium]
MTTKLFLDDAYTREAQATVVDVTEAGGIVLDQTNFYARSGGQPGDRGTLSFGGATIAIADTVYATDRETIIHQPAEAGSAPGPGDRVTLALDWAHRLGCMKMHSALHLMCALVPFPVTGGQVGPGESRLDFDCDDPSALDKDKLTEGLNALVAEGHAIASRWITDAELDANPDLVRTMSVQPPRGSGRIRLVAIGDDGGIDLQPCGGTHVASTGEIGGLQVTKIEKKGKQNRRVRVALT